MILRKEGNSDLTTLIWPHEALRSGTVQGGLHVGMDAALGSITPGMFADLVVIETSHDPRRDSGVSEPVQQTMANEGPVDARTMHEVGSHPGPRRPFCWEEDGFLPSQLPAPTEGGGIGCGRPGAGWPCGG